MYLCTCYRNPMGNTLLILLMLTLQLPMTQITMDSAVTAAQRAVTGDTPVAYYTYGDIRIAETRNGRQNSFIERNYTERRRIELAQKSRYIQSQLQNLYVWTYVLTERYSRGLEIDLRDLKYTYGLDISVYDLDGNLLAQNLSDPPEDTQTNLIAYTEFLNGGDVRIGFIVIPLYISKTEIRAENYRYFKHIIPPLLILLFVTLVIGFFGGRHLLRVRQRRAKQQYDERVDALQLEAAQMARNERETAWRTMARQVAHEINNPLTPMKLTLQQLQRIRGSERFDPAFDKAVPMLIEEIDNLSRIATSFSTFAKIPEVRVSAVPIAEKLTAAIDLFRHNEAGIPIRYVGPDNGVVVMADAEQIGQVFTNILRNAVQALENTKDGDIIVMLKEKPVNPAEVEISISDNGPGIPHDIQNKVFMPNFTTKSSGSGLGLAISKNIVEGSGGHIDFKTSNKGTTFYIYLTKSQLS